MFQVERNFVAKAHIRTVAVRANSKGEELAAIFHDDFERHAVMMHIFRLGSFLQTRLEKTIVYDTA